jgi:hypothetical protein
MRGNWLAATILGGAAIGLLVGGGVGRADAPPQWKNLQILPKTISKDDLKGIMKGQAKALGVECDYCHDVPDMASDKNDKKNIGRKMLAMNIELNDKYIKTLKGGDKHLVTCGTCHQGKTSPPAWVPPADGTRK